MIVTTIAPAVSTLLCLAFDATKWIGVAGLVLLFYLNPLLFTALFILGGVAFFLSRHHKRSKYHALPKLPPGRD